MLWNRILTGMTYEFEELRWKWEYVVDRKRKKLHEQYKHPEAITVLHLLISFQNAL